MFDNLKEEMEFLNFRNEIKKKNIETLIKNEGRNSKNFHRRTSKYATNLE